MLEAKNGTEALALAKAYKSVIDLMITDVVMPQMGGARLAAELQSDRPEMRVLFFVLWLCRNHLPAPRCD